MKLLNLHICSVNGMLNYMKVDSTKINFKTDIEYLITNVLIVHFNIILDNCCMRGFRYCN